MKGRRYYLITIAAFTLVLGCEGKRKKKSQGVSELQSELLEVPVSLNSGASLALAQAVASYSMSLKGCASGRAFDFNEATATISLYKGDSGCYVVLNSFKLNGQEVDPGYSTSTDVDQAQLWEQGDEIDYTYNSAQLKVKVLQQLSNSIGSVQESVSFSASESKIGVSVTPDISVSPIVSVGSTEAPNFLLDSVEMSGVSEGKATYNVTLSCAGTLDTINATCDGFDLSSIQYALVEHPEDSDGNTISPLSISDVRVFFSESSPALSLNENGEIILSGVVAPTLLSAASPLVFILKGDGSFRYFELIDLYL